MSTSTSNDDENYFGAISETDNVTDNIQQDGAVGHNMGK
jgi:hypothetical protein